MASFSLLPFPLWRSVSTGNNQECSILKRKDDKTLLLGSEPCDTDNCLDIILPSCSLLKDFTELFSFLSENTLNRESTRNGVWRFLPKS